MTVFKYKNGKLVQVAGNSGGSSSSESSGSSLPVGSIFASAIPQTDARVHLLDGSTISQDGIYADFANLIKSLVATGNNIAYDTNEEFDADVTLTGNCGKFVIDNDTGTIRLPKITTFIQGLTDLTNIGSSLSAGLPNITGDFKTRTNVVKETTGLFNLSSQSVTGDWSQANLTTAGYNLDKIDFNASNSNSIYGNSSTVQPPATQYPYYIVLASGYKSSQVVDIDNVINDLNNLNTELLSKINGTILWSGSSTGNITLIDNINNYKYLEIYYAGDTGTTTGESSKRVQAMNYYGLHLEVVEMDSAYSSNYGYVLKQNKYNLVDNTLTVVASCRMYKYQSDSIVQMDQKNQVVIRKIIGYK